MQLQNYLLLDTYGKRKPYCAMIQYENLLSAISKPLLEDFTVSRSWPVVLKDVDRWWGTWRMSHMEGPAVFSFKGPFNRDW